MGRTHGGFKCGEAVVKGAENGDDVVSYGLALSQSIFFFLLPSSSASLFESWRERD